MSILYFVESAAHITKEECPEDNLNGNQNNGNDHQSVIGLFTVFLEVSSRFVSCNFEGCGD